MARNSGVGRLRPDQVKEITAAFNEFDGDRNGYITAQEMRECLRKSNVQHRDAEVEQVIAGMDDDRDGTVSFDEYMKFMTSVYTAQASQLQRGSASESTNSTRF